MEIEDLRVRAPFCY